MRDVELGPEEGDLADAQTLIMAAEAARTFEALRKSAGSSLSPQLRTLLERGAVASAEDVHAAKALAGRARAATTSLLGELDVLLTPSAPGEAPEGLASTGDPVFNRVVTMLGFPAISLPAGTGPAGLPLGIQLVGAPHGEAALLAVAAWVESRTA